MQEIKTTSIYKQSLRERIVVTAMTLFARSGIRAVKMDDIAQQLGISKRTLYEVYENKEVLLFEGLRRYKEQQRADFEQMLSGGHSVMDIIMAFYRRKVEELRMTSPLFFSDIERYPRIVEYLEADKDRVLARLTSFLERGAAEGYFRSDLDFAFVAYLTTVIPQHVVNAYLENYCAEDIMHNLILVTIRGICTQRGIDVLDEFMNTQHTPAT